MTSRAAATRYARALFDVAVAERADLDRVDEDLSGFAALVAGNATLAPRADEPGHSGAAQARGRRATARAVGWNPGAGRQTAGAPGRTRSAGVAAGAGRGVPRSADGSQEGGARRSGHRQRRCRRSGCRRCSRAWRARPAVRCISKSRVDPAILGGAIARIGGTVYDGSVTRQLEKMKQALTSAAE